jgi:hypothetical protein
LGLSFLKRRKANPTFNYPSLRLILARLELEAFYPFRSFGAVDFGQLRDPCIRSGLAHDIQFRLAL